MTACATQFSDHSDTQQKYIHLHTYVVRYLCDSEQKSIITKSDIRVLVTDWLEWVTQNETLSCWASQNHYDSHTTVNKRQSKIDDSHDVAVLRRTTVIRRQSDVRVEKFPA